MSSNTNHEMINTTEDVLRMLDTFLRDEGQWWDGFYSDREKKIPFFVDLPDEHLVSYFESGAITSGKVLELGCGPGRNALYMARQGCDVDAVDISEEAINWAKERAKDAGVVINFQACAIFDFEIESGVYEMVYDSGCLHHVPPHRRPGYFEFVKKALKDDGRFSLAHFRPEGGSGMTDWEVYREGRMKGGLGYTEERLRSLLEKTFNILEFRQMKETTPDTFGVDFMWTILMKLK